MGTGFLAYHVSDINLHPNATVAALFARFLSDSYWLAMGGNDIEINFPTYILNQTIFMCYQNS